MLKMDLKNVLINKISQSGNNFSFRDFMQVALYYPELGYYSSAREKISSKGDFITATSQSSLFARTFARQFALIIAELGSDTSIVEFGAGSGKFATDCVDELKNIGVLPKKYIIIELSNDLRLRQQNRIKTKLPDLYDRFIWLSELPQEKVKAIVFANEVLDAMPVDVFKAKDNKLIQQGVEYINDKFEFTDLSSSDSRFNSEAEKILADGINFDDNYTSELNTWISPWIKSIRDSLSQGMIFLCDYGYHRSLYYSKDRTMGTLACYHQHKVNFDPFINIGEQDITAHVDFTAVAEAIKQNGFDLDGYITQANFLKRAGISEVFLDMSKKLNTKEQLGYNNDMKDLILNDKLAEVFKVFAFSINMDLVLEAFDNDDNIDYLL